MRIFYDCRLKLNDLGRKGRVFSSEHLHAYDMIIWELDQIPDVINVGANNINAQKTNEYIFQSLEQRLVSFVESGGVLVVIATKTPSFPFINKPQSLCDIRPLREFKLVPSSGEHIILADQDLDNEASAFLKCNHFDYRMAGDDLHPILASAGRSSLPVGAAKRVGEGIVLILPPLQGYRQNSAEPTIEYADALTRIIHEGVRGSPFQARGRVAPWAHSVWVWKLPGRVRSGARCPVGHGGSLTARAASMARLSR